MVFAPRFENVELMPAARAFRRKARAVCVSHFPINRNISRIKGNTAAPAAVAE
jgi:hypothetical protein